jgi:4-amino-4-deoxy-L-arabinose transferase-like glycosyltransferase
MRRRRIIFALSLIAAAIVVLGRLLGPADLYDKDQPKTLTYTIDMLENGRLALPRDMLSQPATKPPMYNWIAAAVVGLTSPASELAQKSPTLVGLALAMAGMAMLVRWREVMMLGFALLMTYGIDVIHGSTIRLMFLARPDMLQAGFLTLGWAMASLCVVNGRKVYAAGFWACFIGAALTKGPMAMLLIVYAIVAAKTVGGSWSRVKWLRPGWGAAGSALIIGAWLGSAYLADPQHVRSVMLGAEIIQRVTSQSPEGNEKPVWNSVMWFFTKGGITSVIAVSAGMMLWRKSLAARAAALWVIVILIALSLPAGKRMDYLLPAYPPAALLAAMWAARLRVGRVHAGPWLAGLAVVMSVVLTVNLHTRFPEARLGYSDAAKEFARDVRRVTDEPIVVLVRGKHPLMALLSVHNGSLLTPTKLERARWVIVPVVEGLEPRMRSGPLPVGFDPLAQRGTGELGLYGDELSLEQRIAAARQMADWTTTDNPYRAPGTVWKE